MFGIEELLMAADPFEKLIWQVGELCLKIARGTKATHNGSVYWQLVLRITSICLSSLGSAGVIADRASTHLFGESGWAFWASVILLGFGILSQIANEFQVVQRAADSRLLAEKCEVYDETLGGYLNSDDPRTEVASLLLEMNALFKSERYNKVLPRMTTKMANAATDRAKYLIGHNKNHWKPGRPTQKGMVTPRKPPPPAAPVIPVVAKAPLPVAPVVADPAPETPKDPTGEKTHGQS
jgi:hypothetical protein